MQQELFLSDLRRGSCVRGQIFPEDSSKFQLKDLVSILNSVGGIVSEDMPYETIIEELISNLNDQKPMIVYGLDDGESVIMQSEDIIIEGGTYLRAGFRTVLKQVGRSAMDCEKVRSLFVRRQPGRTGDNNPRDKEPVDAEAKYLACKRKKDVLRRRDARQDALLREQDDVIEDLEEELELLEQELQAMRTRLPEKGYNYLPEVIDVRRRRDRLVQSRPRRRYTTSSF